MPSFRLRFVLQLCLFFVVVPSVARAGLVELIDGWSGPGSFLGYGFSLRVACQYGLQKGVELSRPDNDSDTPTSTGEKVKRAIGFIGPVCLFRGGDRNATARLASLEVGFGSYYSKKNHLWDGYETTNGYNKVHLTNLDVSAWYRVARSVELGTGGGVFWINGPAFDPFTRAYLRPVQIDLKPLVIFKSSRLADKASEAPWGSLDEILAFRAGLLLIPSGFKAKDFGAPGTYNVTNDVSPTVQVMIDLEPLVRRVRRTR